MLLNGSGFDGPALVGARLAREPRRRRLRRHRPRAARGRARLWPARRSAAEEQDERRRAARDQGAQASARRRAQRPWPKARREFACNARALCSRSPLVAALVLAQSRRADAGQAPRVRVLATGGTIAGAQASASDYGYKSGRVQGRGPDQRRAATSTSWRRSTGEQVANIGSQDMNDAGLAQARQARERGAAKPRRRRRRDHARHRHDGGDRPTSSTSSSKSDKPVVLVGSMRPATAVSADGPANLYNARRGRRPDPGAKGRGVLVVLNDEIHAARNVDEDQHHQRRDLQEPEPRPGGPGAHRQDRLVRADGHEAHTTSRSSRSTSSTKLPRVDIIYAHANMSPDLIDAAVKNGAKGLVIAGVGDGNMTKQALDALDRGREERRRRGAQHAPARRASCCATTRSTTTSWASSRRASSTRRKSRVLLQLALTKTKDPKEIQRMFDSTDWMHWFVDYCARTRSWRCSWRSRSGDFIGQIRIATFQLGSVVGVLLAGDPWSGSSASRSRGN